MGKPRLILIEDNFPIAEGLKYLVESAGYTVVATAGSVADGLTIAGATDFDVALLDIDLRGESVAPVAEKALTRGKSVIFLSGYGETDMLPQRFQTLPRLEKPVDSEALFAELQKLPTAKP
jgi:DNA-binding response OmpR family regulator